MSKKRIILHGRLKELAPSGLEFEAATAKEAIEGLCRQVPALQRALGRDFIQARVLGFDTLEAMVSPTDVTELHLVPYLGGGKNNGIFQIIIGVVLIVVGVMTYNLQLSGYGAQLALGAIGMGVSMVLGGVMQLLAPQPTIDTTGNTDPEASKILPANQNTVKIGTRIPLGYGRYKVYGHFLSFSIQSTDVVMATLT